MKDLAIATMTFAKTKEEAELMESALKILADKGYSAYVADGASPVEGFARNIGLMGHQVVEVRGLAPQQRDSISRASDKSPFVLYTEPDKYDWFVNGFERFVDAYSRGKKGFAAVGRTPEQMKTFPPHQQYWENKMNSIIEYETGIKGDFIYGPKFFPSVLGNHVKDFKKGVGWQTVMFLPGRAYNLRMPIEIIETASECPINQRREDNAEYREKQFEQNKLGFYIGLKQFSCE